MTVFQSELRGGEYRAERLTAVPAAAATVGDLALVGGRVHVVTAVDDYAAGDHDWSPVANCLVARCVTFGNGNERWFGHRPGQAYRGVEVAASHPDGIVFRH